MDALPSRIHLTPPDDAFRPFGRSFCYVDDLVDGLLALMETEGLTGPVNADWTDPATASSQGAARSAIK